MLYLHTKFIMAYIWAFSIFASTNGFSASRISHYTVCSVHIRWCKQAQLNHLTCNSSTTSQGRKDRWKSQVPYAISARGVREGFYYNRINVSYSCQVWLRKYLRALELNPGDFRGGACRHWGIGGEGRMNWPGSKIQGSSALPFPANTFHTVGRGDTWQGWPSLDQGFKADNHIFLCPPLPLRLPGEANKTTRGFFRRLQEKGWEEAN